MTKVALVSIDDCRSLALRNLAVYATRAEPSLAESAPISLLEYDLSKMAASQLEKTTRWSFSSVSDFCLQDLLAVSPQLIGFSCYLWNIECIISLSAALKRIMPGTKILLGGPNAGPMAEELLARHDFVDFVVDGDGEVPFTELLCELSTGGRVDLGRVPNLVYRENGHIIRSDETGRRFEISLLEGVYDRYPVEFDPLNQKSRHIVYETQRGCPYRCTYCMYGARSMVEKEVETVVDDLLGLLQRGFHVEIADPCFTHDTNRAKRILQSLSSRTYTGTLYVQSRPESMDVELVGLLRQARTRTVGVGLQTVSEEALSRIKRPADLARIEKCVRLLQEGRVPFYVDLMYGLPHTTVDDFLVSLDYLYSLGVQSENFCLYRLLGLPGAPLLEEASDYGMVFSPSPPYELLCSNTFDLADLVFCGLLSDWLYSSHNSAAVDRHARRAGSRLTLLRSLYATFRRDGATGLSESLASMTPSQNRVLVSRLSSRLRKRMSGMLYRG